MLPIFKFFLMTEEVMLLTALKDIFWPVGKADSLDGIHTSHLNMDLRRAGLPFPWADPAHERWLKPMQSVDSHNFVVNGFAGGIHSSRELSSRN